MWGTSERVYDLEGLRERIYNGKSRVWGTPEDMHRTIAHVSFDIAADCTVALGICTENKDLRVAMHWDCPCVHHPMPSLQIFSTYFLAHANYSSWYLLQCRNGMVHTLRVSIVIRMFEYPVAVAASNGAWFRL